MKTIQITIDKTGQATVDAQGFTDAGCKSATAKIEAALAGGSADVIVEDKAEAHIPESTGNSIGLGY